MGKKIDFKVASISPQPVESWVANRELPIARKALPELEKVKKMTVNVPASLYLKFKKKAAGNDSTIRALICEWIEDYCQD